jgi:hypothetical protein
LQLKHAKIARELEASVAGEKALQERVEELQEELQVRMKSRCQTAGHASVEHLVIPQQPFHKNLPLFGVQSKAFTSTAAFDAVPKGPLRTLYPHFKLTCCYEFYLFAGHVVHMSDTNALAGGGCSRSFTSYRAALPVSPRFCTP